MSTQYHVRMRGKVHGPFRGSQLKKLADSGKLTREAEIRGGDGPWYPADKVAGLFDDAPAEGDSTVGTSAVAASDGEERMGTGSASSSRSRASAGAGPCGRTGKKRRRVRTVEASDVFELEEEEAYDDLEFEDEYDDFPAHGSGRSGRSRSRGRRRGPSWGHVRTGLLLLGIAVSFLAAAFASQALLELILELKIASNSPPSRSTGRFLEFLAKGTVFLAPVANVLGVVGCAFCVLAPSEKGCKGLAIATLATLAVHTVVQFVYLVLPMIDEGMASFAFAVRPGSGMGFGHSGVTDFVVTWFPLYAALILWSLLLWAVSGVRKDDRLAAACLSNVWIIGIYVGLLIVGYVVSQVWEPNVRDRSSARSLVWLLVLLRLGHLSLYGVYVGRLIPHTFSVRSSV